jgi:hypothetical protein
MVGETVQRFRDEKDRSADTPSALVNPLRFATTCNGACANPLRIQEVYRYFSPYGFSRKDQARRAAVVGTVQKNALRIYRV